VAASSVQWLRRVCRGCAIFAGSAPWAHSGNSECTLDAVDAQSMHVGVARRRGSPAGPARRSPVSAWRSRCARGAPRDPQQWLLQPKRISERAQRELARRVRRHAGQYIQSGAGIDEDHMTSGTAQRQQQCLRQRHRADHVDVERRSPIVDTRRGEAIGKRRHRTGVSTGGRRAEACACARGRRRLRNRGRRWPR